MNYSYYFDESFHDRKITKKSLKENDYFNSYISVGIGIEKDNSSRIFKNYSVFEKKFVDFYSCKELKSDVIGKKHYKYGLATFNNKELELYLLFFEQLLDSDIKYYISICDKLEYLLKQCKYSAHELLNIPACIYSLTKLINVYRPLEVLDCITNNDKRVFSEITKFLFNQLKQNGTLKLKFQENQAIKNILFYLNDIDVKSIIYEFDYTFTYYGFKKHLDELKIKDVNIYIDKEGNGKIYKCAKNIGFKNVYQIDSKESEGIRIADMLCGFISRMMRAIYEDTKNDNKIPYTQKHLLNEKWFELTEYSFNLYKKISEYFKKYINIYYGSYISIYFDLFDEFMGLIYYFDKYNTFDEYKKFDIKHHCRECNNIILYRINEDLKRLEE